MDFDTEWNDFLNVTSELGEKFKNYWNTNQNTLITYFRDFSQDRKRKKSYLIPVHSTAVARRKFSHRSHTVSQGGRQHKEVERRAETFTTETDENIWHSLPNKTRPRIQLEHSLSSSVANNRHNAKEH